MAKSDETMGGAGERSRLLSRNGGLSVVVRGALIAGTIAILLGALSTHTRVVERLEHWLGDWRFALAGAKLPSAHPDITLLLVREESLLDTGRYSPLDRAVLADLIAQIDGFEPRVIGLDVIFDIETEQDGALLAALGAAKSPVVLGVFEDRSVEGDALTPRQTEFQSGFLEETGRPAGFVNLATDFDRVVRRRARPVAGGVERSFSDLIAETAGAPPPENVVERIDWLVAPETGGDAFTRLFADQLEVLKAFPARLEQVFKDRVVIVASGLRSMADYHITPLDQGDSAKTMGGEIVAQMVAQRLDERRVLEFGGSTALLAAAGAAFFSALLTMRHGNALIDAPLMFVVLFLFDTLLFVTLDVIAPLGVMVAAVGLANIIVEALRRWWPAAVA